MKDIIIKEKSFKFAVRIINLYIYLKDKKEFTLSKQILRSGTSIGATLKRLQVEYLRQTLKIKSAFLTKKPEKHIIG